MATLAELHTALDTRVGTITNLRHFDHPPQGGAVAPVAFTVLESWQPIAMGRKGYKIYLFRVIVFTGTQIDRAGYSALMEFADSSGAKSIELAIWDGNDVSGTFGGLASTSAMVKGFEVLGQEAVDAYQMFGGVFSVEVETKGS